MGAFLPSSKVMVSDGTFKRIDNLEVGESIQTYVESSETHEVNGITYNNIGTYEASTVATITSSSVVGDYKDANARLHHPEEGLIYLPFDTENIFEESKFSIDTEFYTNQGFKQIGAEFHLSQHLILDSLNIPSDDNSGYKAVVNVDFYKTNDTEMPATASASDDYVILSETPLYTIETTNGNPYIVSNFIIKN